MANHTSTAIAPVRAVVRVTVPDPRHPSYRDLHLACGHVLVGRHIPWDRTRGCFRRITRCRCHLCQDAVAAPSPAGERANGVTAAPSDRPSTRWLRVQAIEPCGKDRAAGE